MGAELMTIKMPLEALLLLALESDILFINRFG